MIAIKHSVTLDPVRVYSVEYIEAAAAQMLRRQPAQRATDRDMIEIRRMIEGWGRTARAELRCPATWWQHLKLALRTRWPRLFWRLKVRFEHAIAENGAIVADLGRVMAGKRVIPYSVPIFESSYVDDPTAEDEP